MIYVRLCSSFRSLFLSSLVKKKKKSWGKSAKHSPQRCGLNHQLADEDVIQIVTKTNSQQKQDKNYQQLVQNHADKYHKKKQDAKKQKQKKLGG
jgi:hypothetical protein